MSKSEEENNEWAEVTKIGKFYEFVHDKNIIGLPAYRSEDVSDIKTIEKWPLCQAYGLDIVGGGFFTMKHKVRNIFEELNGIY